MGLICLYDGEVFGCSVVDRARSPEIENSTRHYNTDSLCSTLRYYIAERGILSSSAAVGFRCELEALEPGLEPGDATARRVCNVLEALETSLEPAEGRSCRVLGTPKSCLEPFGATASK